MVILAENSNGVYAILIGMGGEDARGLGQLRENCWNVTGLVPSLGSSPSFFWVSLSLSVKNGIMGILNPWVAFLKALTTADPQLTDRMR